MVGQSTLGISKIFSKVFLDVGGFFNDFTKEL